MANACATHSLDVFGQIPVTSMGPALCVHRTVAGQREWPKEARGATCVLPRANACLVCATDETMIYENIFHCAQIDLHTEKGDAGEFARDALRACVHVKLSISSSIVCVVWRWLVLFFSARNNTQPNYISMINAHNHSSDVWHVFWHIPHAPSLFSSFPASSRFNMSYR